MTTSKEIMMSRFGQIGSALALALTTVPTASMAVAPAPLSLQSLEARARKLGVSADKIEVKGMIAKVEGRDALGRKVELSLHRRTGEVLHREFDD